MIEFIKRYWDVKPIPKLIVNPNYVDTVIEPIKRDKHVTFNTSL